MPLTIQEANQANKFWRSTLLNGFLSLQAIGIARDNPSAIPRKTSTKMNLKSLLHVLANLDSVNPTLLYHANVMYSSPSVRQPLCYTSTRTAVPPFQVDCLRSDLPRVVISRVTNILEADEAP